MHWWDKPVATDCVSTHDWVIHESIMWWNFAQVWQRYNIKRENVFWGKVTNLNRFDQIWVVILDHQCAFMPIGLFKLRLCDSPPSFGLGLDDVRLPSYQNGCQVPRLGFRRVVAININIHANYLICTTVPLMHWKSHKAVLTHSFNKPACYCFVALLGCCRSHRLVLVIRLYFSFPGVCW